MRKSVLVCLRLVNSSQQCLGFVQAFLVFALRDTIGDDASTRLDISDVIFDNNGTYGDSSIQVAREVEVAYCSGIWPSSFSF